MHYSLINVIKLLRYEKNKIHSEVVTVTFLEFPITALSVMHNSLHLLNIKEKVKLSSREAVSPGCPTLSSAYTIHFSYYIQKQLSY